MAVDCVSPSLHCEVTLVIMASDLQLNEFDPWPPHCRLVARVTVLWRASHHGV